jgi:hypothetical protein
VYPDRIQKKDKLAREKWWLYLRPRKELYELIRDKKRVLVRPRVSNTHAVVFLSTQCVFSNTLNVFTLDGWGDFSLLQSTIHQEWARDRSSTLKDDMTYHPSDCFEPFPRCNSVSAALTSSGEGYYKHRSTVMSVRRVGLTKLYSEFHEASNEDEAIQKLRQLHVEMDNAVAAAYDWTDLDLGHGFHETKQGVRYTISEPARREVLARLLTLNHERYAEEVKQGLHEKKKVSARKPTTKKTAAKPVKDTATLFDMQEEGE